MENPDHQLPPNAKLVFKGVIFDVWQWEQKMFDGSTATFERLRRPDTAQVIPVVGDKILLQVQQQPNRLQPFPSLPGGRFDEGEEPLAAAKRELLEETGYVSDDWVLWRELRPVNKIIWTVHSFIAHNCRYQQPPHLDAGERIENKLVSFDELLALADDPAFYDKELAGLFAKIRFDPAANREFRDILFPRQ